jgi:hypothetical protein
MRRLASTAAVLALVALPGAAQAEQPPGLDIPAGGFSSDMNAQDGRLVWKVSARAGSSRLMTAVNGQPFEVRVEPLTAGFIDVALGRDAQGRVVATYARCDRPRGGEPPENCDPYAYTFTDPGSAAGQERRLPYALRNVAEFGVAIDGNFMVLGRRFAERRGDARLRGYLYAGRADGSTKLHRLPTGPQRTDRAGVGSLDIEEGRVVFEWQDRFVRFDTLGARQRILAQGDAVGFALDGPLAYVTSGQLGEGPNLAANMQRIDLATGATARSPGTELLDFAVEDGRFFVPAGNRIREVSPPPSFEP